MAMAISNVPVLTGEAAEAFVRKADEAMKRRGSIDFTEQRAEMKLILANAKFEQCMGYLAEEAVFMPLSKKVLEESDKFTCGNDDLDDFFQNDSIASIL